MLAFAPIKNISQWKRSMTISYKTEREKLTTQFLKMGEALVLEIHKEP